MASTTGTLTVRTKPTFALAWIKLLTFLAPVLVPFVGHERVLRWGKRGAYRLMLVKVGDHRWQTLR